MRHHVSLFLTASFLFLSQGVHGSTLNHDDDNVAAPASAVASRAPVLNPNDEFSTLPTHVLRQIGDIFLENDPKSLGRFLQLSRTTNALKDQIFHTTQTMGTKTIDGKERTAMHYAGANNTKDRILELLGRQTGNPELFKKDHARDYQDWSKTDLLKLLKNKTLEGALDANTSAGQAYFELETLLKDTSRKEVDYCFKGLLLFPTLRGASHLEKLFFGYNNLIAAPVLTGLRNLRCLYLDDNQIVAPPDLTGLMNLEVLDLSDNQIIAAPDLTGLTKLMWLDLRYNKLNAPPVVTGLTNLEWVYLDSNLCCDQKLLETLRILNRERTSLTQLLLWATSKDAQGDRVETEIPLD